MVVNSAAAKPHSQPRPFKKLPTDIAGLDVVLGGGLPQGRTTALEGAPGSGKSCFCTNIAANCAGRGDACIYISFEMSPEAVTRDAASLAFNFAAFQEQGSLIILDGRPCLGLQKSGEFDLGGLLAIVGGLGREKKAKLVVLDAVEVLLQHFGDPAERVQAMRQLHAWLENNEFTTLITMHNPARSEGMADRNQIEFMTDCLIYLDQRLDKELATRRLRVVKYRGSDAGRNEYPFIIGPGGVKLMAISDARLDKGPLIKTISSGHPVLDKILGGGYRQGSSTLLTGETGTGKTTFACTFAGSLGRKGKKVLYAGFEESSQAIIAAMRSSGLDLRPVVKKGNLRFHTVMPESMGSEEHLIHLVEHVKEFKPDLLVVDAISAFLRLGSVATGFNFSARLLAYMKSHGVTTLLLNQIDGLANLHDISGMGLSTLLDTVVFLRYVESEGEMNRVLLVLKSRGMAHSNQFREYAITSKGIHFPEVYTGTGGVKTGTARKEQEAREDTELRRRQALIVKLEREAALKRVAARERRALADSEAALAEAELEAAHLDLELWHQDRRQRGVIRRGYDQKSQNAAEQRPGKANKGKQS